MSRRIVLVIAIAFVAVVGAAGVVAAAAGRSDSAVTTIRIHRDGEPAALARRVADAVGRFQRLAGGDLRIVVVDGPDAARPTVPFDLAGAPCSAPTVTAFSDATDEQSGIDVALAGPIRSVQMMTRLIGLSCQPLLPCAAPRGNAPLVLLDALNVQSSSRRDLDFLVAHELGHAMGLAHDQPHLTGACAPAGRSHSEPATSQSKPCAAGVMSVEVHQGRRYGDAIPDACWGLSAAQRRVVRSGLSHLR